MEKLEETIGRLNIETPNLVENRSFFERVCRTAYSVGEELAKSPLNEYEFKFAVICYFVMC